jgi:DtxR family Mn-dependent transcriptional regulator
MGHPTRDPHGDPIPSQDLSLPEDDLSVPLQEFQTGVRGIVMRVGVQDPENLDLLDRLGLALGSLVEVLAGEERGLRVRVGKEDFLVPTSLAEALWVEKEKR